MNKKKIAILISIIIIILLFLVLLFFVITNNKDNKKEEIKDDTKIEEKIDKKETPTEDIPKEESPIEEETPIEEEEPKKEDHKKEIKPVTPPTPKEEEKPVVTQEPEPITHPTPTVEYTCPNGYTLNGNKCTITTNATLQCPEGTVEGGEPSGCFKFSEGVEVEGTTCPAGQVGLTIIGWGTPDKYMCHPSYNKVYVCESGYEINGTKCTKTIDAIQK
jgi:hypothetical protein